MKEGKHVILVVDDDQDVREGLRVMLESGGYAMAEAPSAEDAKKEYDKEKPELLIVDMMMENIDSGLSLIRDIRGKGFAGPIYVLSSVGDELSRHTGSGDLKVAGILQKPVNREFLLRLMDNNFKK